MNLPVRASALLVLLAAISFADDPPRAGEYKGIVHIDHYGRAETASRVARLIRNCKAIARVEEDGTIVVVSDSPRSELFGQIRPVSDATSNYVLTVPSIGASPIAVSIEGRRIEFRCSAPQSTQTGVDGAEARFGASMLFRLVRVSD